MLLGTLAVGTTVYLKYNGKNLAFCVVHHGKPDASYDDSFLNGTILLLDRTVKDFFIHPAGQSETKTDYAGSYIHKQLSESVFAGFEPDVQALIRQVRLPYRYGISGTTVRSGSQGLSAKVWAPSATECGREDRSSKNYIKEGAVFDFWKNADREKYREWCLNDGTRDQSWVTRTPEQYGAERNRYLEVDYDGVVNTRGYFEGGVRPCLVLPDTTTLDAQNQVVTGQKTPVCIGGAWRDGQVFCRVNGVWKQSAGIFTKIAGMWKR